ncbi:MAG: hypothetical protein OXQ32_00850 [bacterium]|nr:hypothetical protein [bacterium]
MFAHPGGIRTQDGFRPEEIVEARSGNRDALSPEGLHEQVAGVDRRPPNRRFLGRVTGISVRESTARDNCNE